MKIRCEYKDLAKLKDLKPHPRNRNKHSADQIDRLAKIFEYQGVRHPIIVSNLSGFIVAGHGRLAAAKKAKLKEFPVDYQDFETEEQEYAFLQSDNAIALWAELDLAGINADLGDLGPDFDIDLLGIKDFTLDVAEQLEPQCDEDEVPEHVEPKTKLGDIYQLGRHRLMCGDSTSIDAVEKLMDGEKAECLFTDPPYNIDFKPQRGTHDKILNDNMSASEFKGWLSEVFSCAFAATVANSYAFVWSGWSTIDQFAPVLRDYYQIKAMPIWVKNNFGIGYYSRPKYEPFFLCLNGDPEKPQKAPADVWEYAKVVSTVHSCEKPVGLIQEILETYNIGSSVLDLFGGSGSTLIAAEKTGRKAYLMELDPHYCDVIVARWEKYTGKQAELLNG